MSDKVIKGRIERGVSTWNANLKEMAQLIIEVNNEFNIFDTNQILYAIMNESEKTAYSTDGTVTETFDDGVADGLCTRWEYIMDYDNCTKLAAACICLIAMNTND